MNFTYENQGTTSFLSYTLVAGEEIDAMGLGMVQNNKISGVLPIAFTQIDKDRYLRYNISSTVTLSNFFSGIVTRKRLLSVFESICDCFLASEEYLLENAFFILEKDYMFCDVSTGKTSLVYLPVLRDVATVNLPMFFKETIFSVQSDLNEDGSHVARIINYLNSNDNFSLKEFRQLIVKLKMEGTGQPAPQSAPRAQTPVPPVVTHTPAPAPIPVQPKPVVPTYVPAAPAPVEEAPVKEKAGLFAAFGAKKEKKEKQVVAPQVSHAFAIPGASETPAAPVVSTPVSAPAAAVPEPAPAKKGLFGGIGKQKNTEPVAASAPSFAVPGAPAAPAPQAAPVPTPRPAAAAPTFTPVAPVPQPAQTPPVQQAAPQTFPQGTTVLSPDMLNPGTTVLTPGMMPGAVEKPKVLMLTRLSTKESVPITKNIFRIGKERSYVDYFIADNSAISRSHADIITKDGAYFIRDNNSLNHTYLDNAILQSNQEYPVQPGSKILLADEEFSLELV